MPWYVRLSWLLHTVSLDSSCVLAICYWILLFDGKLTDTRVHNNFIVTVILLIDHWIIKQPSRLVHVVYSILYFAFHLACMAAYCTKGSSRHYDVSTEKFLTYDVMCVYPKLTGSMPMFITTGVLVIALFLYPAARIMIFLLYKLRIYIWERYGQPG